MLTMYLFRASFWWGLPLLFQIVCYFKILKKMDKRPFMAILPVLGEYEMSTDLFRYTRSFWRPTAAVVALYGTALYVKSSILYSLGLKAAAILIYSIFLIRLYYRLARQFGKSRLFAVAMVLMPYLFLAILAFGRSVYLGKKEFAPTPLYSPAVRWLRRAGVVLTAVAEVLIVGGACFLITYIARPIRPIAAYDAYRYIRDFSKLTDSEEFVTRQDTLGEGYETVTQAQQSRDYFFPDHSDHQKVVVMEYIIGSNLEDARGSASINIGGMKQATARGSGLDFVIQTGGSDRWFTWGIKDKSVGRYLISEGKLSRAELLPETTCMSEQESLTDFITWTKEHYPADRYMLVLWDHGGGFAYGFGQDELNIKHDQLGLMRSSEIVEAIRQSGVVFDVIGFDACLMQDIELATALEPYADFYLASEESEPAFGWLYGPAFGKLAEDPTLRTEEFGQMMVSSYDQLYRFVNDGTPQPEWTLSLVDLTLVKPAYDKLFGVLAQAADRFPEAHVVFGNISAARARAYEFGDKQQVDIISYLTGLKAADYREQVATDEELDEVMDAIKACVVCRNKDSGEGIHGLSMNFPYSTVAQYNESYQEYKKVQLQEEMRFFNTFCSILAGQQTAALDAESLSGLLGSLLNLADHTSEEWYVEGFEDYDTADLFIDIPVREVEDGYLPELPEKTWESVLDAKIAAYLVTEEGRIYLGQEHFDATDEAGHALIGMEGRWAAMNGRLMSYQADTPLQTEEGIAYRGTAKARLNDVQNITVYIEWETLKKDATAEEEAALTGRVVGYTLDDTQELPFLQKGKELFKTGDKIEFLFDYYDEQGQVVGTAPYGDALRVVAPDKLQVKDEPFPVGTKLSYYGVLTDVYQRELLTEEIQETVVG